MGLTVAAAMWKPRAIVASDGILDQVVDGEHGLLAEGTLAERG
jgi:hypothetical protein